MCLVGGHVTELPSLTCKPAPHSCMSAIQGLEVAVPAFVHSLPTDLVMGLIQAPVGIPKPLRSNSFIKMLISVPEPRERCIPRYGQVTGLYLPAFINGSSLCGVGSETMLHFNLLPSTKLGRGAEDEVLKPFKL